MNVLFFSLFGLPDSCAAATRVMNLAKVLKESGHELDLVGITEDDQEEKCGAYDELEYRMLHIEKYYGIHAGKRIKKFKKTLKTYLYSIQKPYDCIILSNIYYDYADEFMKYAKKTGTKLIVNSVEWYEKDNARFRGITGKLNFIKNRIALMHTHVKMGNILAISSLLDDYYKARGCNTVTVPTIIDVNEYESVAVVDRLFDGTVKVAYAGVPGKKDYIVNAIKALALLSEEERAKIELHFYGPNQQYLTKLALTPEELEACKEHVICHGKIPYQEVKERIAAADFTVLLRPNKRYANAGFPTKVGESMACGTPVIANITSDLGKYILDGKTGIVCKDESPEACAEAFRRALALTEMERKNMNNETVNMAKKAFDYRIYVDMINGFLMKLR